MQPYDVRRFDEVILDKKEQERWCRAVLLGGLPANRLAMTTDFKCVLLDLRKREAISIPDDIRAAAAEMSAA